MDRIIFPFESEEKWKQTRAPNINSSEVAALFNLSPYTTRYEMYHQKKDSFSVEIDVTEKMRIGNYIEEAIGKIASKEHSLKLIPKKEYISIPSLRIGSSFDFSVLSDDNKEQALGEAKNVGDLQFKQGWLEDDQGNVECPPHIELQVQQQMLVADINLCYIFALVGGSKLVLIKRHRDDDVCSKILTACAEFWKSIDDNIPPDPDFEQDAEFLQALYQNVNQGSSLDARGNDQVRELVLEYKRQAEIAKKAESMKQAAKSELLTIIGDNEKVFGDGFKISAGLIGPTQIAYERKGYRDFRIFAAKGE